MLDLMYEIPSDESISRCVIDKEIVENNLKIKEEGTPTELEENAGELAS